MKLPRPRSFAHGPDGASNERARVTGRSRATEELTIAAAAGRSVPLLVYADDRGGDDPKIARLWMMPCIF